MIAFALGVLAGICWLQIQAELPAPPSVAWWVVALALMVLPLWRTRFTPWVRILRVSMQLLSGVLIGGAWANLAAHAALGERLSPSLDRQIVLLDAVIQDLPSRDVRSWRFEVRVLSAHRVEDLQPVRQFPKKGVVHWYANGDRELPMTLKPGDRWRFQARVRQPAGTLNPGGFDLEAWMLEKGLGFNATVQTGRQAEAPVLLGRELGMQERIDDWRDRLRQIIAQQLGGHSSADVVTALVVGDQRAITAQDWALFQRTGVAHLMSISGLHVTMFAALLGWSGAMVWRLWCRTPMAVGLWVPVQSVRAGVAVVGAMGYALLAGFAVPAQRTAWMLAIVALATIVGVRASPWAVIAFALLVVVLADPFAVLAPGFWLSFLAVAFLFALPNTESPRKSPASGRFAQLRDGLVSTLVNAGRAQLAITFGLLPLTVLLFQQVILVGPLANAVAIPVVSFLVTPLAMVGVIEASLAASGLALGLAAELQSSLEVFLQWCAGLSFAALDWPSPGVWRAVIASLGMVLVFGRVLRGSWARYRVLGWFALGALWGVAPDPPSHGQMRVHVIDVGQGSSLLVRTHRHAVLIDTGPQFGAVDAGLRMVMPELRRLGIRRLDRLVLTHLDRDHSGGLGALLANIPVGDLMTSRPESLADTTQGSALPQVVACGVGQHWQWDGVTFRVLHPLAERKRTQDTNRDSCVLHIQAADGASMLVTGDIPMKSESELVSRFMSLLDPEDPAAMHLLGATIASQVLIAPHHGSKTSLGDELLSATTPRWVVITAGFRNRFGHPHQETLERIARSAPYAGIARTDLQGALTIEWPEGKPRITDFWAHHRRYWHLPRHPP